MTTIVYRDGVMAADTRATSGEWIVPGRACKIRHVVGPALVGISGDPSYWDALLAYLDGRAQRPQWEDDARALIASAAGIRVLGKGGEYRVDAPFAAIGSGAPAAWAALHMGATAARAVGIAMLVDPYTGGTVDTLGLVGAASAEEVMYA